MRIYFILLFTPESTGLPAMQVRKKVKLYSHYLPPHFLSHASIPATSLSVPNFECAFDYMSLATVMPVYRYLKSIDDLIRISMSRRWPQFSYASL